MLQNNKINIRCGFIDSKYPQSGNAFWITYVCLPKICIDFE